MPEVTAIDIRLKHLEEHEGRVDEDIRCLKESLGIVNTKLATTEAQYAHIMSLLKKLEVLSTDTQTKVDELRMKPGRRWDSISNAILQWAVLAILAASQLLK